MKRVIVASCMIIALGFTGAFAQMGGGMGGMQGGQGMMMDEAMMKQMMPMMQMCRMMSMSPSGEGMMTREMMKMMMDMMDMQEKMMSGVKQSQKKQMMAKMAMMKNKMQNMMSMQMGMMTAMGGPEGGVNCAKKWLKDAIDLHEVHIKDPKTATDASQMEMMEQMKKAYECLTGPSAAATVVKDKSNPNGGQEKTEAGVTVKVSREGKGGAMAFKVVLETHTVELDGYKFDEIVSLRADGKEYKAMVKSQEGSGHHRSAIVEFDNTKAGDVTIVIKGVAGVKERTFKF